MSLLSSKENIREFFAQELCAAMRNQQVSAIHASSAYLVDLMLEYMAADKFFTRDASGKLQENVLVDLYAEYMRSSPEQQKMILKRLGDICLLVTGFFSDSLNRKLVDVDYYFGMGGTAYWQLSQVHISPEQRSTFEELARKFKPFSNVLGELSERMGITSNKDILRIYEKWLHTGSDHLKDLLSEHGIHLPIVVDPKDRH